jgi:bacillithiol biosynthesis cysteine-adding enzyme BshC
MRHTKIAFADTKAFSKFFLDYIQQSKDLQPFYGDFPSLENFNKSLTKKSKSFPEQNRIILKQSLSAQYSKIKANDLVKQNIEALGQSKTFTVTTGHQLNIFTGPLYFIYKIVTVINTCKRLREKYPDYKFVPVYWMASEDHDYDEIKYFRLYGKKYTWETSQTGAVGRFNTKELASLADSIPGDVQLFKKAYTQHEKLSDAVRYYINELFGNEGVVAIDADDRPLKSLFTTVMRDDIVDNKILPLVESTNKALEQFDYKAQVYCRDTNFFYLDDQIRARIEKVINDEKKSSYKVVDSAITLTEAELLQLIQSEPEKFSPNVILRPLYQEVILPNLAYVGGPAEVVYWLQLKNVFDHYQVPFPLLMPRNFAMIVDHTIDRKFGKTGLDLKDLFEDKNFIFNHWVLRNTHHNLTIGKERNELTELYDALAKKADAVDKTLVAFVQAEGKRALNGLERIEKKLLRAEKRLHSDKLRQLEHVKDALFPNGNLQERTDNFLNFYQQDKEFIQKLISHLDPLDFTFNILTYTA